MKPQAPPPAPCPQVPAFELRRNLGAILDRLLSGEALILTRHGKPVAYILPARLEAPVLRETFERLIHGWGQEEGNDA